MPAGTSTRDFAFPLNVFAHVLERQEGRVDYLHFAAFERPDEPVLQAQERATAMLWSALPPPCRLLEVGIGLGTTLSRLGAAGYHAMGITPDAAQIAQARQRHGDAVHVECARLEDFSTGAGSWNAMLFQESAQYIEPLALFMAAERLLTRGPATLVVMDEFALKREDESHWGLHLLPHFIAMANRFGWRLVQHADLSREVQPTLDYLLRTIAPRHAELRGQLGLDDQALAGLDSALRRSQRLYRDGFSGYALLRFEREAPAEEQVLRVGPGDAASVRGLFHEVFGHPLSPEEWHWKYGDGRGTAVALLKGGRWLGHYGGLTRDVLDRGQPAKACQVCDVIVHPDARASLSRRGPLHKMTATFLESEIGWGLRHRVGFGFPTDRAFGIAQRLGLYFAVDQMLCAHWPAAPAASSSTPARLGPLQPLSAADLALGAALAQAVDALWRAMAAAFNTQVLGVRDAAWLRHRYLNHPRMRYEVLLLRSRWWRRPLGVVVVRRHESHLEWVDVVAPPAAWPALLQTTRAHAAGAGLQRVDAWITASQRHLLDGLAPDVGWRPLAIDVPGNAHSPGPDADDQRGRWLLMAGDTDFR